MKIASLLFAALLVGCAVTEKPKAPPEARIAADLIGHTTGGRESSWKFRPGQIQHLEVLSSDGDQVIVLLRLHTAETNETFMAIVEINYFFCLSHCHEKIESVGLRYIRKI